MNNRTGEQGTEEQEIGEQGNEGRETKISED